MKKEKLLQIRVEKQMLDCLKAVAKEKNLPLSVMVRQWFIEEMQKRDDIHLESSAESKHQLPQ